MNKQIFQNKKVLALIISVIAVSGGSVGAYVLSQPQASPVQAVGDNSISAPSEGPISNQTINAVNSTIIAGEGSTIANPSASPTEMPLATPTPAPTETPITGTYTVSEKTVTAEMTTNQLGVTFPTGRNLTSFTITVTFQSGPGTTVTPDMFSMSQMDNSSGYNVETSIAATITGTPVQAVAGSQMTLNVVIHGLNTTPFNLHCPPSLEGNVLTPA